MAVGSAVNLLDLDLDLDTVIVGGGQAEKLGQALAWIPNQPGCPQPDQRAAA